MPKSEKTGKQTQKTFVHFTARGMAQCSCGFVCVGGDIQKDVLLSKEVNVVRDICFGNVTCAFVIFSNVQVIELHSHNDKIANK
jgi:hypothetical protein